MGYDTTIKTILLFLVAVNCSLFIIGASGVLPVDLGSTEGDDNPIVDPDNIAALFVGVDFSTNNIILGGVTLAVGVIVGWIAGSIIVGGVVGIGIFGFTLFSPIVSWILFGLPKLLNMLGVPVYISATILAMMSIPLFFTVLGMIVQRPVEGHG